MRNVIKFLETIKLYVYQLNFIQKLNNLNEKNISYHFLKQQTCEWSIHLSSAFTCLFMTFNDYIMTINLVL